MTALIRDIIGDTKACYQICGLIIGDALTGLTI